MVRATVRQVRRAWNLAGRNGETITGQRMIVGVGKGTGAGVAMYVEGVQTHRRRTPKSTRPAYIHALVNPTGNSVGE